MQTADLVAVLSGHSDWVRGVSWSPDGGRLATTSHDQSIRIWSLGDPKFTERVIDAGVMFWDIAWSPDRELLATTSPDGFIRLWDAVEGQQVQAIHVRGEDEWLRRPAWSPVGRHLAAASTDRTVAVWESETDEAPLVLTGHTAAVWDVAWVTRWGTPWVGIS